MLFFPAIDLKDGNCVRLICGDMENATVFDLCPEQQAKDFEKQGARWLHVIDLNGAFAGKSINNEAIKNILQSINIPIQLGGGIRSLDMIEYWLSNGVQRVILGTIALRDPEFVIQACRLYPDQIIVGIDVKDSFVAVEGWAEVSKISALNLARRFENVGVAAIIYTDISRDGLMQGPNLAATFDLASSVSIEIILSGGVSSMEDLVSIKRQVKRRKTKLGGVISGRAIYEGKIDVVKANLICSA